MKSLEEVSKEISEKLGKLRKYQEVVLGEILKEISKGRRFVVVCLPTGSGKTWIEIALALSLLDEGRILVIEPTRFLCDQMYVKAWRKVFPGIGKDYEGKCQELLEEKRRIAISTPKTALKAMELGASFDVIIVDEAHRMFLSKVYHEILRKGDPKICVGFTALVPKKKIEEGLEKGFPLEAPKMIKYDFRALSEIDPTFSPPKAILDIYEAEFCKEELELWKKLINASIKEEKSILRFFSWILESYGSKAFMESYERALAKGKIKKIEMSLPETSHKARALRKVLQDYTSMMGEIPLISIISRRATAKEFYSELKKYYGKVFFLSGETPREERIKLIKEISSLPSFAISTTSVGEEGIDLPEAQVLILGDLLKSPVKFYQRLGRLIRISSKSKIKYLVILVTPRAQEYENLVKATDRLRMEGVDVDWILLNPKEKGIEATIKEMVLEEEKNLGRPHVPLRLLALSVGKDPIEILEKHLGDLKRKSSLYSPLLVFTAPIVRGDEEVKRAIKKAEKEILRAPIISYILKNVREGKLMYYYDPEVLGSIIAERIEGLRKRCKEENKEWIGEVYLQIDRKALTLPMWNVFLTEKFEKVKEELLKSLEREREGKQFQLYLRKAIYSENSRRLMLDLVVQFELDVKIFLRPQISYYEIPEDLLEKYLEILHLSLDLAFVEALSEISPSF